MVIEKEYCKIMQTSQEGIRGIIFNIERYAIQDGPGIRTTVFMKGCPLRCQWCSNPESQLQSLEIMVRDNECVRCGKCIEGCPTKAISLSDLGRIIDRAKCNLCLQCATLCPQGAIYVMGKHMSVEEVIEQVDKDNLFYQNSGGGVTISGGEPLFQAEFVLQVFKGCQQKGIHTALDTSGYAAWATFRKVLEYVDLVLYDLKHMNSLTHKQFTGIGNELILSNLKKTAHMRRTWLRFPLIPGFNDSDSDIRDIAKFGSKLPVEKLSILPYHSWGKNKYEQLGRVYPWNATPPGEERINEVKRIIEDYGLKCTVGS